MPTTETSAVASRRASSEAPIARSPERWGRYHDISRSRVYELINEGVIVARKLRGRTLIFDADNEHFRKSLPVIQRRQNAPI